MPRFLSATIPTAGRKYRWCSSPRPRGKGVETSSRPSHEGHEEMRFDRESTVRGPRFEVTSVGVMMTKKREPQNQQSTRGSRSLATLGALVLSAVLVGSSRHGVETSPGSSSDPSIEQPTSEESTDSTPSPSESSTATSGASDPDSPTSSSATTQPPTPTPTVSTDSGSPA